MSILLLAAKDGALKGSGFNHHLTFGSQEHRATHRNRDPSHDLIPLQWNSSTSRGDNVAGRRAWHPSHFQETLRSPLLLFRNSIDDQTCEWFRHCTISLSLWSSSDASFVYLPVLILCACFCSGHGLGTAKKAHGQNCRRIPRAFVCVLSCLWFSFPTVLLVRDDG